MTAPSAPDTSSMLPSWFPMACRIGAVLIAIVAVVDPTVSSMRRSRPIVAVVASNFTRDSVEVDRIKGELEREFTVVSSVFPAASGTVVVGASLPVWAGALFGPVVAVAPNTASASLAIRRINAPVRAMMDARVSISVLIESSADVSTAPMANAVTGGASRDSVVVELVHNQVVVSRQQVARSATARQTVVLDVIPTRAEPMVLRVRAFGMGATGSVSADTVQSDVMIDVQRAQWSVLFFDRRPSWMSTFVRRAVEQDPRFRVSSRIVTSKDVSRETGSTPQGLDEVARSAEFDVVVVGAPEALTRRDIEGLTTLLNVRGASVVMLPDNPALGAAASILGINRWNTSTPRSPVTIMPFALSDTASTPWRLRGTSYGVPTRLSAQAEVVGVLHSTGDGSGHAQPIIWRVPTGHGVLVVSGAFDAWRYRDAAQSTFDDAWRDIIDDAASRRQRAVELRVSPTLMYPREPVQVTATFRDNAALVANGSAMEAVTADRALQVTIQSRASTVPDSLTLAGVPDKSDVATTIARVATQTGVTTDQRVATFRAPLLPGVYDVVMAVGPDTARTAIVVATDMARDLRAAPALMNAWAQSRGGRYLHDAERDSVSNVLRALIDTEPQRMQWHPMRSPWWIVPVAMLLSYEWWIRRRRGQR